MKMSEKDMIRLLCGSFLLALNFTNLKVNLMHHKTITPLRNRLEKGRLQRNVEYPTNPITSCQNETLTCYFVSSRLWFLRITRSFSPTLWTPPSKISTTQNISPSPPSIVWFGLVPINQDSAWRSVHIVSNNVLTLFWQIEATLSSLMKNLSRELCDQDVYWFTWFQFEPKSRNILINWIRWVKLLSKRISTLRWKNNDDSISHLQQSCSSWVSCCKLNSSQF